MKGMRRIVKVLNCKIEQRVVRVMKSDAWSGWGTVAFRYVRFSMGDVL